MRSPEDIAEALAYADGCLPAKAAAALERRLEGDAALKRDIEGWRRQNAAIRAAFEIRRSVDGGPPPLRGVANANRAAGVPARSIVTRFPARRGTPAAPAIAARGRFGRVKRIAAILALAMLGLASSAPWTPNAAAQFRAEAERAWLTYGASESTPPPVGTPLSPDLGPLPGLMRKAWRVPGERSPASFAFDSTPDGKSFAVLIGVADAIPAFGVDLKEVDGGSSAVWSDGRRMIAIFGPEDAAATLAEARRLSRP